MEPLKNLITILSENLEILFTFLLFIGLLISRKIARRIINRHARKNELTESRVLYTSKFFNVLLAMVFITLLAVVWNVTLKGLSVYFASIFTVVGIAFFAQWSILSNISASVILFFNYTVKMGTMVKIIDGDNSVKGKIIDITLFYIKIEQENGSIVSYPNNLAIQRPILEEK